MTVMGWAAKRRDLGGLIFVDLRDRTGIVQVVFDASVAKKESFEKAESIRSEYVLAIKGKLRLRSGRVGLTPSFLPARWNLSRKN